MRINDLDLKNWKQYSNILTDSLWIINKRDSSDAHSGEYWGNFIPQIPNQMLLRYTREGETVLDAFLGLGTTLIECVRLRRNGIGIELNAEIARIAKAKIEAQQKISKSNAKIKILIGDSRKINIREKAGIEGVQLLILHPPYHDVIKFSSDKRDLSNAPSVEEYLHMFNEVLENTTPLLDSKRFLVLVIGDKYQRGEWVPLGFLTMNEVLNFGFKLKSIIVKNIVGNERGKGLANNLWRYRAFKAGFYIFKHEYIMVFQKNRKQKNDSKIHRLVHSSS
ncbi:MAG: DNA methyltransferase [Halobacteria archaeon]